MKDLIINEGVLSYHDLSHYHLHFLTIRMLYLDYLLFLNPYRRINHRELHILAHCIHCYVYRRQLCTLYLKIYNQFYQEQQQRKHNQEVLFLKYPKI